MAASRDEPPDLYCDPITHELMDDPVSTPNGQTYERSVIEDEIRRRGRDPQSQEPLTVAQLRPNIVLKNLIDNWKIDLEKHKKAEAERMEAESCARALEAEAKRKSATEKKDSENELSIIFAKETDADSAEKQVTEAVNSYEKEKEKKERKEETSNKWLIRRSASVPEYCFTITAQSLVPKNRRYALISNSWVQINGNTREEALQEIQKHQAQITRMGSSVKQDILQGLLKIIENNLKLKKEDIIFPTKKQADTIVIEDLKRSHYPARGMDIANLKMRQARQQHSNSR